MFIVVLWHSSVWMTDEVNRGVQGVWFDIGLRLGPLRMPLFFFISGFFGARAVRRPLDATRSRTVGMYYLYAVWTAIFISRLLIPQARGGHPLPVWYEWILALLLPTSFWYLWCLVAYFLVTHLLVRLLRRRAVWMLVPLVVLSVLAPLTRDHTIGWVSAPLDAVKISSMLANFVWFYAGVVLVDLWTWLMRRARWAFAAGGVVLYLGIFWLSSRLGTMGELSWQMVPLSALALLTMSQLLALLPMDNAFMRMLQRIGRDTLPIYIFHIFLISLVSTVVKMSGLMHLFREHLPLVNWVVPPLMMVTIVPTTRLIARFVRSSPLAVLLKAPAAITTSRAAAPRRSAGPTER